MYFQETQRLFIQDTKEDPLASHPSRALFGDFGTTACMSNRNCDQKFDNVLIGFAEEGEDSIVKELPIVLKADVAGSLDALISALTSVSGTYLIVFACYAHLAILASSFLSRINIHVCICSYVFSAPTP
jgi:hypothetical protein